MGVSTATEAVKAGWASMAGRAADGKMPVHLVVPDGDGPFGGVIVAMEAFGLEGHMKSVAERIAREGDVVAAPDFYYRAVGEHVVGYDQLPRAIELMMERASGIKLMLVMTPELSDVASAAPLRQAPGKHAADKAAVNKNLSRASLARHLPGSRLAQEPATALLEQSRAAIALAFRSDEGTILGPEQTAPEGAPAADQLAAFPGAPRLNLLFWA